MDLCCIQVRPAHIPSNTLQLSNLPQTESSHGIPIAHTLIGTTELPRLKTSAALPPVPACLTSSLWAHSDGQLGVLGTLVAEGGNGSSADCKVWHRQHQTPQRDITARQEACQLLPLVKLPAAASPCSSLQLSAVIAWAKGLSLATVLRQWRLSCPRTDYSEVTLGVCCCSSCSTVHWTEVLICCLPQVLPYRYSRYMAHPTCKQASMHLLCVLKDVS